MGDSERILRKIEENSKDDEIIADFLKDLLLEELEHSERWWWKEKYKEKIENYSKNWSDADED